VTPSKPNAHFSLNFGTSAAASCAIVAGWKRCCAASTPQPFQCGSANASADSGIAFVQATAALATSAELFPRNRLTASISAALSLCPWLLMLPPVSAALIDAGDNCRIAETSGARITPPLWHSAQCALKIVSPAAPCVSSPSAGQESAERTSKQATTLMPFPHATHHASRAAARST
jgi:hypothetical protein